VTVDWEALRAAATEAGRAVSIARVGSLLTVFFRPTPPLNAAEALAADRAAYARFFGAMLDHGILLPPSQFEAWFVSMAHRSAELGATVDLGGGRTITALPANHVVPAIGYQLDSGKGSLVFTGDTTTNNELWPIVNKVANLKYLIIECAFCNREKSLAIMSKHLCPSMLAEELAKLERSCDIFITHLKPGEIELTMEEIEEDAGQYRPRMLQNNQVIEF